MENQPKPQQINIKVKDKDLKGGYSNVMRLFSTKEEFILDFFLTSPPQGILTSRVIVSPGNLKRMAKVINQNIDRYEQMHGKIEEAEPIERKIGFNSK